MAWRAFTLLAALLLACSACSAEQMPLTPPLKTKVKVAVAAFDQFPYRYYNATSSKWEGFLMRILDAVAEAAYLEVELVPFSLISERIPMLQKGEVDFIMDIMSATAERMQEVDFVHPGFFSTGAALYTTAEIGLMMGAAGGWKGLGGVPICVIKGYYGTGPLVEQYKISPVEVPDFVAAADAVISGKCTALAYDSGQPAVAKLGLPQAAGVPLVLTMPYAIPVKKGNMVLRRRLSAALVELMQDGNASPILEWEKEFLSDNGVLASAELFSVVQAISYGSSQCSA